MFIINSKIVKLHGAADSLQGGRPDNQDDLGFADTPLGFLLIVCDGMGGGPGGKTASYIAKYVIANILGECSPQMPRDKAFKMAVSKANDALEEKMEQMPSLRGMGSTFVAVLINSESAMVAYAGDSRCYRLHGKRILFRTKDHSLVGELVRMKAITEEQARTSPQSNVISRGLGSVSNHVPEIYEIPYRKGDRLILCTDGVWGTMPQKELVKWLSMKADCRQVVGRLSLEIDKIGKANGGHHDNHTIAIIEMESNSIKKDRWLLWGVGFGAVLAFAVLVVIVMAVLKGNKDSATDSITMKDSLYPTEAINANSVAEKGENRLSGTFADTDSLSDDNNDSMEKTDSILLENPEEWKGSGSRGNGEQSAAKLADLSKAIETAQRIINRLDSLAAYKCRTKEESVSKKESYLNQIKSLLVDLRKSDIPGHCKTDVSNILKEVETSKITNLLLCVGKYNGMYESIPASKEKADEIRIKIEQIQKILKDNNGDN